MVMMVVGVMQFAFTVLITLILHRNSQRHLRLDILRSIDSQWQDLNKLIVSNPQIRSAVRDETLPDTSDNQIIRVNIVYYTLNTFQQIVRAREQGFISTEIADSLITGHVNFLKQFPAEIKTIVADERGLDKTALGELKKYFDEDKA